MQWVLGGFKSLICLVGVVLLPIRPGTITAGNFRLIDRLMTQIVRIKRLNQLSMVTKEVVDAARECLVIGSM